ncbi:hypothetical protein V1478_008791 [Vespula squamosa]|uniref:Uncharacterized protein n=1 Tax=Vespula squamosa TaxID=30214 RepID=A0ABD2AUH9_VESSQ
MVVVGGWVERADMEDRLEVRRWCAGAGGASKGGDEERSSLSLFQKTSRTSICRVHDTNEGLMMNGEDER